MPGVPYRASPQRHQLYTADRSAVKQFAHRHRCSLYSVRFAEWKSSGGLVGERYARSRAWTQTKSCTTVRLNPSENVIINDSDSNLMYGGCR